MPTSPATVRRSRHFVSFALVVFVVALVGAIVAVVLLGDTPHDADGRTTTTTTSRSTTTSAPPTTTTAPQVTPIGTYSVATTSLTVTGLSPTDDQLPTTVWYPLAKSTTSHDRAPHLYPLLIFSQGFAEPVASYSNLITDWASAGFVVAGPTYPHTAPSAPTTLDRADLVHHPADLRAVITAVLAAARTPASALSGKLDPSEIGVAGQSDGGDVSLALADNSCCRYPGVKAAAILSGAEYATFGGQYFPPGTGGPPLLVVQGSEDQINPPVCSVQIYDAARAPKFYLDLLDATHLGPYTQPTASATVVATVTTEFFDAELAGERVALSEMTSSGDVPSVARLSTGSTVTPVAGACPTAS